MVAQRQRTLPFKEDLRLSIYTRSQLKALAYWPALDQKPRASCVGMARRPGISAGGGSGAGGVPGDGGGNPAWESGLM
jgi:hypothetical protein